jgi:ankyrin repeat protein
VQACAAGESFVVTATTDLREISRAYLLERGAAINEIPAGFDYAGTGLHYAAYRGHRAMVEFLLGEGADPTVKDPKVHSRPAGWAEYGGHADLKELLDREEIAD